MGRRVSLKLASEERSKLQWIVSRGENWRERDRAQTLILLDDGLLLAQVADKVGIHVRTVGFTRLAWLARGFESLIDRPRSGAPTKISPEQLSKVLDAARNEPLTAKALLAKHVEEGGTLVHLNTLKGALRAGGFVWKRTRHSLKKKRNEADFRRAEAEIELLKEQAEAGELVLAYVDEAGFAQVHPNCSAWTAQGERHLIEAKRGKRLNVLAAMLSTGGLFSSKFWQTTNSDSFVGFIGLLREHVGKPLTVILDNASIHKAKANAHIIKFLETQGVSFYFLPPYSPELNRIEKLWHLMKHTWMAVKCRNSANLEEDVAEILDNFGTMYNFAF